MSYHFLQRSQELIYSAYSLAEGRLNSRQLNANVNEIIARARVRAPSGRLRYPASYAANLTGYDAALQANLWRHKVGFAYRDDAGRIYWTSRAIPDGGLSTSALIDEGKGYLLNTMQCAHLWLCNGKEYTHWELLNRPANVGRS